MPASGRYGADGCDVAISGWWSFSAGRSAVACLRNCRFSRCSSTGDALLCTHFTTTMILNGGSVRLTRPSAAKAAAVIGVTLGAFLVPASPAAAANCSGGSAGGTGWYGPCASPPDGDTEIRVLLYCRNVITGAVLNFAGPWVPWNEQSAAQCYLSSYTVFAVGGQSR